jgi:CheY-like chemotaxis protein
MCDYSLMAIPNRVAVSGDELVVHRFQTGSLGLASASDLRKGQDRLKVQRHGFLQRLSQFLNRPDIQSPPAVCIPPGARLLVQDIPMRLQHEGRFKEVEEAVFIQVTEHVNTFRDAVRFQNGVEIPLQNFDEGQRIRVVELSTALNTAAAPEGEQSRMEYSFRFSVRRCTMLNAKEKLLIVDDDVSVRESLTELFTDCGLSVRSAEDGSSALFEIWQEVPDIILSDLNMPHMSGCEFLSLVRHRYPAIRVVAMSGAFSGDDIPPWIAADAFYEKGSNLSQLLQIVQAMTSAERSRPLHSRASVLNQNCAELT